MFWKQEARADGASRASELYVGGRAPPPNDTDPYATPASVTNPSECDRARLRRKPVGTPVKRLQERQCQQGRSLCLPLRGSDPRPSIPGSGLTSCPRVRLPSLPAFFPPVPATRVMSSHAHAHVQLTPCKHLSGAPPKPGLWLAPGGRLAVFSAPPSSELTPCAPQIPGAAPATFPMPGTEFSRHPPALPRTPRTEPAQATVTPASCAGLHGGGGVGGVHARRWVGGRVAGVLRPHPPHPHPHSPACLP